MGGTTSAGIAATLGYANGRLMGDPKYPNLPSSSNNMQKPASLSLRWVATLTVLGGNFHVEWVAIFTGIHTLVEDGRKVA